MSAWTADDLQRVGHAEERQLASRRPDGSLRSYVTMWVVRAGDDLYVRSAYGPDNPWYRRARHSGVGRIRAGGVERDVTFAEADDSVHETIDRAYHAKYDGYGPGIVGSVVGAAAHRLTVRLLPSPTPPTEKDEPRGYVTSGDPRGFRVDVALNGASVVTSHPS